MYGIVNIQTFATGSEDTSVCVWEVRERGFVVADNAQTAFVDQEEDNKKQKGLSVVLRSTLKRHQSPITCLCWRPDNDWLVVCDRSGLVRIWRETNKEESRLRDKKGENGPLSKLPQAALDNVRWMTHLDLRPF